MTINKPIGYFMFPRHFKHVVVLSFMGITALMAKKYAEITDAANHGKPYQTKQLSGFSSGAFASLPPNPSMLHQEQVAFSYILGTQHKDKTERLAYERNWLQNTSRILHDYSNHVLLIGDGTNSLDFTQLPKTLNQQDNHIKHNIVWANFHGLPAKLYSPEAQDSFYCDTYISNEYSASKNINGELLSYFIDNLKDVALHAQNTFVIQSCYSASSIMAVKNHKEDDMCIFPDPCYKPSSVVYPFFLKSIANTNSKNTNGLNRSLFVQQLLIANAMGPAENRNLFIFTIKTAEKTPDPSNNGINTRVISLEDECKNLDRYSAETISLAMESQGFSMEGDFGTYIKNVSKNIKTNHDLYALNENDFMALTLATYYTSMIYLSNMPRLPDYFLAHNVVRKKENAFLKP